MEIEIIFYFCDDCMQSACDDRVQSTWKVSNSNFKGRGQDRPLDFSLKSNMGKTATNFTYKFVYTLYL